MFIDSSPCAIKDIEPDNTLQNKENLKVCGEKTYASTELGVLPMLYTLNPVRHQRTTIFPNRKIPPNRMAGI
jgi:hypothetical protein